MKQLFKITLRNDYAFKQFGFDINKIAEGTGLPVEEIEAL